ncbi:MAG: septal ring lytic transglycosylase RlpA family protein [Thermoleophilaceae bacterium]
MGARPHALGAPRPAAAALCTLVALAAAPAGAAAQQSGGESAAASPDASSLPGASGTEVEERRDAELRVRDAALRGGLVTVRGRLSSEAAGGRAVVEVRSDDDWREIGRPDTDADGRFSITWRPSEAGTFRVRVRPLGEARAAAAGATASESVTVFRPGLASWYGPGFYGRRTACGQTMSPSIVGVAHKTLPCGTRVTFRYGKRTVQARVIDRGPFVGAREWDLTVALKRALGFGSGGIVYTTR